MSIISTVQNQTNFENFFLELGEKRKEESEQNVDPRSRSCLIIIMLLELATLDKHGLEWSKVSSEKNKVISRKIEKGSPDCGRYSTGAIQLESWHGKKCDHREPTRKRNDAEPLEKRLALAINRSTGNKRITGQTQTLQELRGNVGFTQIMGLTMMKMARRTGSGPEVDRIRILVNVNIKTDNLCGVKIKRKWTGSGNESGEYQDGDNLEQSATICLCLLDKPF